MQTDLDHLQSRLGTDRRLVQPEEDFSFASGRLVRALEHQVLCGLKLAGAETGEVIAEFLGREIRQETQSPHIHSKNRRLTPPQLTAGSQNGTVAADHHDDVRVKFGWIVFLNH